MYIIIILIFLDQSKHCELSSSEGKIKIKAVQNEMGKFEINVRESTAELEKAIKMNAENPVTEIEKKLWKDFINNPERMEKTVKNMEVYNVKRKNQNC